MLLKSIFNINNIQKKIVFYIVAITVPMFLVSLYLIQNFVGSELSKSEFQKAKLIHMNILNNIEGFLDETSIFTVKESDLIGFNPSEYKKTLPFLKESLKKSPSLFGTALAIDTDGPLHNTYCQYYYKQAETIVGKSLTPPDYDYLNMLWYQKAKQSRKAFWSEPYFDKGGGEVYMCTYSKPIIDGDNQFIGVVTADVELGTLSKEIQDLSLEKKESIFLISKDGFLLSHPNQDFNLKKDIFAYADFVGSDSLKRAAQDMMQGISGTYTIQLPDGKYTLYTHYVSKTAWSIGILLKDSVLFQPLHKLKINLIIIVIIDILLILVMIVIVSNQLKKRVAKDERMNNEMMLASRIQQQFLPKKSHLTEKRFNLSGLMIPAKEVGGDFYGYQISDEKVLFYVGDVSGKGIPASLFMMASQMLIENAIEEKCDPAYILNKLNKKLSQISTTGMFATIIIGLVDLVSLELTFSVAGHPPFIIKEKGAIYSPLTIYAPPVAVFGDLDYQNTVIKIKSGTSIIAFSDGVSEAENAKKEFFDTYRIAQTLQDSEELNSEKIKERLLQEVQNFTSGHEQNDDLTIVVVTL